METRRVHVITILNKFSLFFHMVLACGVCFIVEWVSRHSFVQACKFVGDRNLVFLYNSLIVFSSLTIVYVVRRRAVLRTIVCAFWLFLGIINGCILAKRVSPFSYTDLKMVSDLFTMQSNYFTATEAALVIGLVVAAVFGLVVFWIKGPKYKGSPHRITGIAMVAAVIMMLPNVTNAAVNSNILTSYFENLAQGYKDYGFVYSFSASVLDRGMKAPEAYSEETINDILDKIQTASLEKQDAVFTMSSPDGENEPDLEEKSAPRTEQVISEEYPNIICVLLESFVDPAEISFLQTDVDPVPNFHKLEADYTTGYLEVPVVGAGTANTEFEVLTGMGMQFFGLGEYPYKTILKKTNCESIASDLAQYGYGTHVVHDNGANFYSRRNAFSMMGFDTFTSKEMMNIQDYTPLGTWPQDDIMLGYIDAAMNRTEGQDFVYVITVESHGDYPEHQVLEEPEVNISGVEEEGRYYSWEYYVNQLHEVDEFIGELIAQLEAREEPTMVVMFGDHLPTMGLENDMMKSGNIFLTKYITWNNFGIPKEDQSMTSYQLLADMLQDLNLHTGTMFQFHQNRSVFDSQEEYIQAFEALQYDILYGDHYVYGGENPYPASDLEMGIADVQLDRIKEMEDIFYLFGDNFTKWSKVFVDGEKVKTSFITKKVLKCKRKVMSEGEHTIVVNQMGSSDTILRSSNELRYTVVEREVE